MDSRSPDPAPRLIETPDNTCPPGVEALRVSLGGRPRLRAALWPAAGTARGTVVLLQGRTEFIEKYFEIVGELRARGFAVLTFDWQGQGGSDRLLRHRLKGHVAEFSRFLGDLDGILDSVGARCPKPWTVLAHSMGGLVALRALSERPGLFARAVLSAPMTGIRLRHRAAIAALARIVPGSLFVPGGGRFDPAREPFEGNLVTHDRARFLRNRGVLETCPALGLGSPTWGWLSAAFIAMAETTRPARLRAIDAPVLLLSAGEDQIIDNRTHEAVAGALPRVTAAKVRGARHEIMMETDPVRAEFWRAFDDFAA